MTRRRSKIPWLCPVFTTLIRLRLLDLGTNLIYILAVNTHNVNVSEKSNRPFHDSQTCVHNSILYGIIIQQLLVFKFRKKNRTSQSYLETRMSQKLVYIDFITIYYIVAVSKLLCQAMHSSSTFSIIEGFKCPQNTTITLFKEK